MIVGRGGEGKNTNNAPNEPGWVGGVMGGNGGMIAFKKNIIVSGGGVSGMGWISQIDFRYSMLSSSSPGLYVRYNQSLGQEITAFLGDSSNGIDRH